MKAVLMSIKPEWCELIAGGKKVVELRKTKPKLEVPFKVYIYETRGYSAVPQVFEDGRMIFEGRGQVIGEFICDNIETVLQCNSGWVQENACVTRDEFFDYLGIPRDTHLGYNKKVYGWHISDLVIYDHPKELSEFYRECEDYPACDDCEFCSWTIEEGYECVRAYEKPLKRPPQSWMYVEELE